MINTLAIEGDTLNYLIMFQKITIDEVISHPKGLFFASILFGLKVIGLSFKSALFILMVIVDIVMLKIASKITKRIIALMIIFFIIQWNYAFLSTSLYLLRQSISLTLALYAYFLINNRLTSISIIVVASIMHPISLIFLFSLIGRKIKVKWLVLLATLLVLIIKSYLSELPVPVDHVEPYFIHRLVSYIILTSAIFMILYKPADKLTLLVLSFSIFIIAFSTVDLIWYRIILASYFVVLPLIFINTINGIRHLLIKLQSN